VLGQLEVNVKVVGASKGYSQPLGQAASLVLPEDG
jgi:hypothetical protein